MALLSLIQLVCCASLWTSSILCGSPTRSPIQSRSLLHCLSPGETAAARNAATFSCQNNGSVAFNEAFQGITKSTAGVQRTTMALTVLTATVAQGEQRRMVPLRRQNECIPQHCTDCASLGTARRSGPVSSLVSSCSGLFLL